MRVRMPITIWRFTTAELWWLLLLTTGVFVTAISFALAVKPLADGKFGPLDAIKFMLLAIPPMLQYALPFAAGFGATLAYHRFASQNESLAAHAGGISHRSLLIPSLVTGIVLAAVLFILSNSIIPRLLRSMELLIKHDAARFIVSKINQGEKIRFGDMLVYADLAREIEPPEDSAAIKGIYLKGLLLVEVRENGSVRQEASAASATVWLFQGSQDTEELVLVFNPSSKMVGRTEDMVAVADGPVTKTIPNAFSDDPKFLTWQELANLRDDPAQMNWIERRRRELACRLAQRRTVKWMSDELASHGAATLLDPSGRVVRIMASGLRRDRERGNVLLPQAGTTEIVIEREQELGQARFHTAEEAFVTVSVDPTEAQPIGVNIELQAMGTARVSESEDPAKTWKKYALGSLRPAEDPCGELLGMDVAPLLEQAEEHLVRTNNDPYVLEARDSLKNRTRRLLNEITSKQHERIAMSAACLVMIMTGSVMALRLRESVPLVVYLWSFFPALAAVLTVSAGQQTVHDHGLAGLPVLWSGVIGLAVFTLLEFRKLARR